MRILFSSNAPWVPSGYGQQARMLVDQLKQNNEIIFHSNFGLIGQFEMDNVLYVSDTDYGNVNIRNYVNYFKPDAIISLIDWWVHNPTKWKDFDCPWYPWTPIELDLVKGKNQVFAQLFTNFIKNSNIVTMSSFGTEQVNLFGARPAAQIYHMVNSDIFRPLDKQEARKKFIANADKYDLIFGMVAGNYENILNRKAFTLQFEGLRNFAKSHKDLSILLYLHNDVTPSLGGYDLIRQISETELNSYIDIQHTPRFRAIDMPLSKNDLAELYNCFDGLLNASKSEGFGVPIIEAQSCGIPVLTHNFSAMPELTNYGYSVQSSDEKITVFQKAHALCDDCGVYGEANFALGKSREPDVEDITNGIESIYNNIDPLKAEAGRKWIAETFNPSVIGEAWNDLLNGKRG